MRTGLLKPIAATLSLTAAATAVVASPADWAPIHEAGPPEAKLAWVEQRLAEPTPDPGLHYLCGRLLQERGRGRLATRAFAESIRRDPVLAPWSRLALAELLAATDHPETATGLLVPLLGPGTSDSLRTEAAELLSRVLSAGGDCGLLDAVATGSLPRRERRRALLAEARCEAREGDRDAARGFLVALLRDGVEDDLALEATRELTALGASRRDAATSLLLARALLHQGRYERALEALSRMPEPEGPDDAVDPDVEFLRARARFELGEFVEAARGFGAVSRSASEPGERSRASFFEGRALAAAGRLTPARAAFARAARYDSRGPWAGSALLSLVHLASERGEEAEARRILDLMAAFPQHSAEASRAAISLVADAVAAGRNDRSRSLLIAAHRHRADVTEIRYWEGRADLAEGRLGAAVSHFVTLLNDPWHPLTQDAVARMHSPALRSEIENRMDRWIDSSSLEDRLAAWHLLSSDDPRRDRARQSLYQRFVADPRWAAYLSLAPKSPAEWPLWSRSLVEPHDRLIALGRWGEVPLGRILELFPPTEPALTYTAAVHLAAAGRIAGSIRLAEVVEERTRNTVPTSLLPLPFRQVLYPTPFRELVVAAAARNRVDPALLFAILRETSRFDPDSGRARGRAGLIRLSPPTAERLASREGIRPFDVSRLGEPEVAVDLLASRLSELEEEIGGGGPTALVLTLGSGIAEGNPGLRGALDRPAPELLARIGDGEEKRFVQSVLRSLAAYRGIYPDLATAAESSPPRAAAAAPTAPGGALRPPPSAIPPSTSPAPR